MTVTIRSEGGRVLCSSLFYFKVTVFVLRINSTLIYCKKQFFSFNNIQHIVFKNLSNTICNKKIS